MFLNPKQVSKYCAFQQTIQAGGAQAVPPPSNSEDLDEYLGQFFDETLQKYVDVLEAFKNALTKPSKSKHVPIKDYFTLLLQLKALNPTEFTAICEEPGTPEDEIRLRPNDVTDIVAWLAKKMGWTYHGPTDDEEHAPERLDGQLVCHAFDNVPDLDAPLEVGACVIEPKAMAVYHFGDPGHPGHYVTYGTEEFYRVPCNYISKAKGILNACAFNAAIIVLINLKGSRGGAWQRTNDLPPEYGYGHASARAKRKSPQTSIEELEKNCSKKRLYYVFGTITSPKKRIREDPEASSVLKKPRMDALAQDMAQDKSKEPPAMPSPKGTHDPPTEESQELPVANEVEQGASLDDMEELMSVVPSEEKAPPPTDESEGTGEEKAPPTEDPPAVHLSKQPHVDPSPRENFQKVLDEITQRRCVQGDGECWGYAAFDALGLLEHGQPGDTQAMPTEQDLRRMKALRFAVVDLLRSDDGAEIREYYNLDAAKIEAMQQGVQYNEDGTILQWGHWQTGAYPAAAAKVLRIDICCLNTNNNSYTMYFHDSIYNFGLTATGQARKTLRTMTKEAVLMRLYRQASGATEEEKEDAVPLVVLEYNGTDHFASRRQPFLAYPVPEVLAEAYLRIEKEEDCGDPAEGVDDDSDLRIEEEDRNNLCIEEEDRNNLCIEEKEEDTSAVTPVALPPSRPHADLARITLRIFRAHYCTNKPGTTPSRPRRDIVVKYHLKYGHDREVPLALLRSLGVLEPMEIPAECCVIGTYLDESMRLLAGAAVTEEIRNGPYIFRFVHAFGVAEAQQKTGIGTTLMRELEAAPATKFHGLMLRVNLHNRAAMAFYLTMGFTFPVPDQDDQWIYLFKFNDTHMEEMFVREWAKENQGWVARNLTEKLKVFRVNDRPESIATVMDERTVDADAYVPAIALEEDSDAMAHLRETPNMGMLNLTILCTDDYNVLKRILRALLTDGTAAVDAMMLLNERFLHDKDCLQVLVAWGLEDTLHSLLLTQDCAPELLLPVLQGVDALFDACRTDAPPKFADCHLALRAIFCKFCAGSPIRAQCFKVLKTLVPHLKAHSKKNGGKRLALPDLRDKMHKVHREVEGTMYSLLDLEDPEADGTLFQFVSEFPDQFPKALRLLVEQSGVRNLTQEPEVRQHQVAYALRIIVKEVASKRSKAHLLEFVRSHASFLATLAATKEAFRERHKAAMNTLFDLLKMEDGCPSWFPQDKVADLRAAAMQPWPFYDHGRSDFRKIVYQVDPLAKVNCVRYTGDPEKGPHTFEGSVFGLQGDIRVPFDLAQMQSDPTRKLHLEDGCTKATAAPKTWVAAYPNQVRRLPSEVLSVTGEVLKVGTHPEVRFADAARAYEAVVEQAWKCYDRMKAAVGKIGGCLASHQIPRRAHVAALVEEYRECYDVCVTLADNTWYDMELSVSQAPGQPLPETSRMDLNNVKYEADLLVLACGRELDAELAWRHLENAKPAADEELGSHLCRAKYLIGQHDLLVHEVSYIFEAGDDAVCAPETPDEAPDEAPDDAVCAPETLDEAVALEAPVDAGEKGTPEEALDEPMVDAGVEGDEAGAEEDAEDPPPEAPVVPKTPVVAPGKKKKNASEEKKTQQRARKSKADATVQIPSEELVEYREISFPGNGLQTFPLCKSYDEARRLAKELVTTDDLSLQWAPGYGACLKHGAKYFHPKREFARFARSRKNRGRPKSSPYVLFFKSDIEAPTCADTHREEGDKEICAKCDTVVDLEVFCQYCTAPHHVHCAQDNECGLCKKNIMTVAEKRKCFPVCM